MSIFNRNDKPGDTKTPKISRPTRRRQKKSGQFENAPQKPHY